MGKWMSGGVMALVGVCAGGALAGVIRDDRNDADYKNLAGNYAATGSLAWTESGAEGIGSGTLIAPQWVLTAAHCVDGINLRGGGITGMSFYFGPQAKGGKAYVADQWIPNPKWDGALERGYDIGLVHLTEAVKNVTPAQLFSGDERGLAGTYVGYGFGGDGKSGMDRNSGHDRRAGTNVLDLRGNPNIAYDPSIPESDTSDRVILADFDDPTDVNGVKNRMGSKDATDLEYQITPGDSGGGVYVNSGGQTYLAAVVSYYGWVPAEARVAMDGLVPADASPGQGVYGDYSGSTLVEPFSGWIGGVIAVPEPGALMVVGLGACGLLGRKRQRAGRSEN